MSKDLERQTLLYKPGEASRKKWDSQIRDWVFDVRREEMSLLEMFAK